MKKILLFITIMAGFISSNVYASTGTVNMLNFNTPLSFLNGYLENEVISNSNIQPLDFTGRTETIYGGNNIKNNVIEYYSLNALNFNTFSSSSPLYSLISDSILSDVIVFYGKSFIDTINVNLGVGTFSSGSVLFPSMKDDIKNLKAMKIINTSSFSRANAPLQFDGTFNSVLKVGARFVGISY